MFSRKNWFLLHILACLDFLNRIFLFFRHLVGVNSDMDSHINYGAANVNKLTDKMPEYVICRYCKEKVSKRHLQRHIIGIFSYKNSTITIFGQKHFWAIIQNLIFFRKNFKNLSFWLIFGMKLPIFNKI